MGDPGGSQLTAKTGNDKVNGARGADDKQKTKTEGAGEKNVPEKSTPIIARSLPGRVCCQKVHSRLGAGAIFANSKRGKKMPQNSIYPRNGAAKGAPGGSLGGPWVPLGFPPLERHVGARSPPRPAHSCLDGPDRIVFHRF